MMKPVNHHFSGPISTATPTINGEPIKKWYCTLVYNASNQYMGIAVVGKKDQFCRKTGARIALNRASDPQAPRNVGKYTIKVGSEAEVKEILIEFRKAKYLNHLWDNLHHYFPRFQTGKPEVGRDALHALRKSVG